MRFEGKLYRYEYPQRASTTWDTGPWNVNANHRFTKPGQGGAYGSTTPETALAEVKYHGVEQGRVEVSRDVTLDNVLDLTSPSVRRRVGVTKAEITSNDYSIPQQIGDEAVRLGYQGILAPSARRKGGINLVSFDGF